MGGLVVALLSLPMTIPLGALALSPLGPDYINFGVAAGFHASIVAGIIAALAGGSRYQISGPRASISLIAAGAISIALGKGAGSEQAMIIGYVVVFLAGCLQVGFSLAKFGRVIKYIPYPVLGGFMNGVAILIVLGQLAAVFGLQSSVPWTSIPSHWGEISIPSILVALVTMATMRLMPRVSGKVQPIAAAFILGVALDHVLRLVLGDGAMGPLVGALSGGIPMPDMVATALALPWQGAATGWLMAEIPSILVLALVASVESLLSAAAIDAVTGDRHNSNRELMGQGLGNVVGACFGGIPSTGAPIRGITSFKAGGRSRMAAIIHSLGLLALLLWGKPVLAILPYSVMAGIMIMIAVSMVDDWAFVLVRRSGRIFLADCAVVVLVAATTVLVNLAFAVMIGVLLAVFLFVLRMSRPVVNRVMDGTQVRSLRQRTLKMEAFLSQEGQRIVVLELKGPLFFGTAEQLRDEMDSLDARSPRVIILDLYRVSYIDLSGARILRQLGQAQKQKGCLLYLAGIKEISTRRAWMSAAGVTATIPLAQWFPLLDPALEAAEEVISHGQETSSSEELPLSGLEALSGIAAEDLSQLSSLVQRIEHAAGAPIFHMGEEGDGFYMLVAGLIEIALPVGEGEFPIRLATLAPGTIFGEMALLDGRSRSANAVALEPAVTYFLSNDSFARLNSERPTAAIHILLNIGREMSERLRLAHARFQAVA